MAYRITLKGEDDPASAFAQDARQQAEKAEGGTFELHVHALREPRAGVKEEEPGDEYLKSTYFLDSGDDKIKDGGGGGGRRRDGPVAQGAAHREVGA